MKLKSKKFNATRMINYPKSRFDMSHSHQGSYDWGVLYPIFYEEANPGDYFQIAQQMVAKMMPTIAPIQHEINAFFHYYFVPYRLLDTNWEDFITGGKDGNNEYALPIWNPGADSLTVGSLWDQFNFPLTNCEGVEPIAYPMRAYNFIWTEYYRDENLTTEIAYPYENTAPYFLPTPRYRLLPRAWEKDYFTAALPWQQRGIAPALPVSGIVEAIFQAGGAWAKVQYGDPGSGSPENSPSDITADRTGQALSDIKSVNTGTASDLPIVASITGAVLNAIGNEVDLSGATTFDVADIRAAVQIQRWMERNARNGARYTEVLEAHFNVSPTDERLQRPEYIGGWRQPITITEVLQTSETAETPQGNRSGIGSSYGGGHIGNYKVKEYGIIMGIMSIMPRSMYTQGVNRMWLRRTRYDFLWPEFVNLSEQAILTAEIFAGNNEEENQEIFGYQGRYDELRQRTNRAVGLMRQSTSGLIHWNLSRKFATAPALNWDFMEVEIDDLKNRVFVVPTEPGFIITVGNICTKETALPAIAEPGMLDHI